MKAGLIVGSAALCFSLSCPSLAARNSSPSPSTTPFIVVDQFGYLTNARKIAVLRDPVAGFDSQSHFTPGKVCQVVDTETGKVVYEKAPVAWHAGAVDPSSGDRAWQFDFSRVVAPGRYVIRDKKTGYESAPFSIAPNLYKPILVQAVRMLYYQRAGFPKDARYAGAGWADKASHMGPGQDAEARLYNAKDDPSTARDLHGGWFDAGDFNRYTRWSGDYVVGLLHAYNENPAAFTDDFNIPESGNGIPDLLDEVKWEIDWLKRMQSDDGSLQSVLGSASGSPPSAATGPSFYGPATTSATYAGAAAFAYAAKTYGQFPVFQAFAADLKIRAIRAWQWAQAHPHVLFYNNDPRDHSVGLAAGQQEVDDYGREMGAVAAAVYLFDLTGDAQYRDYIDAHYQDNRIFTHHQTLDFDYPQTAPLVYYASLPGATPSVSSAIRTAFARGFEEDGWNAADSDPYRAHISAYVWGSSATKANHGNIFADEALYGLGSHSPADAMSAAEGYLHYIDGVNPLGKVYLSNMKAFGASNSVDHFYHTWYAHGSALWGSVRDSKFGPPPGYLVGGANPAYTWAKVCPSSIFHCGEKPPSPPVGEPAQKAYVDFSDGWPLDSWEVTEPSVSYQTAYIRLLARFVQ
ncbi:MAG TPA: glycoside hydrolase family 9 protein [Acidobacteriaceae bacterium]|nr:glycoside hydrolase family 9 protein [Acidobacteriaceae bacterium]